MSILENIPFVGKLIDDYGENLVVKGIEKLTGIDISKKDLTPEEQQKILDNEFRIKSLNFEELKLEFENTNNARNMQIEAFKQDDVFSKRFVYYLATFWSVFGVIYIFFITFGNIPSNNVRFADTILGFILGTIIATIINFFFGSSKGSTDKQDVINQLKVSK